MSHNGAGIWGSQGQTSCLGQPGKMDVSGVLTGAYFGQLVSSNQPLFIWQEVGGQDAISLQDASARKGYGDLPSQRLVFRDQHRGTFKCRHHSNSCGLQAAKPSCALGDCLTLSEIPSGWLDYGLCFINKDTNAPRFD